MTNISNLLFLCNSWKLKKISGNVGWSLITQQIKYTWLKCFSKHFQLALSNNLDLSVTHSRADLGEGCRRCTPSPPPRDDLRLFNIISILQHLFPTLFPVVTSYFSSLTLVKASVRVAVITEQTVTPISIHSTAKSLARTDFGVLSPYLYSESNSPISKSNKEKYVSFRLIVVKPRSTSQTSKEINVCTRQLWEHLCECRLIIGFVLLIVLVIGGESDWSFLN